MKSLSLEAKLSDSELTRLATTQPWISSNYDPSNYLLSSDQWTMPGLLVDEAAVGYKPDGSVLFKLIKNPVEPELLDLAWQHLSKGGVTVSASRRGRTIGKGDPLHQDQSGTEKIVGYFDRQGGMNPYCRTTAWTRENWHHFEAATPYIQRINEVFCEHMPDHYANQELLALGTPDYVIPETVFSTITINLNVRTTPHTDKGDFSDGFGVVNVTALTPKQFEGGELIYPKFGVGVMARNGDVLLCDVHELHCNAQFRYQGREMLRGFERLACVFYYRERITKCLPPEEELRRVQDITANWW